MVLLTQKITASSCYLLVENTSSFEYSTVFDLATTLVTEFVGEVKQIPDGGVGKNDCLYSISVLSNQVPITISLKGPDISSLGESTSPGLRGLQQAILIAIFRSDEEERENICNAYQSLIPDKCEKLPDSESVYTGIWYVKWEDEGDIEEIYFFIDEEDKFVTCELLNGEYNDVSDGLILGDKFIWGDEDPIGIYRENDMLILQYEEDDELKPVSDVPQICKKKLSEEYDFFLE